MSFSSAHDINTNGCLASEVVVFEVGDEFTSSFALILPERENVDVGEFHALIAGMRHAIYKLETLVEKLENE